MPTPTPDERWNSALLGEPTLYIATRRMFSRLPGTPRFKNWAAAASLETAKLERRELELKGKSLPFATFVVGA